MTQQTMSLKNTETFAESLARCGVKFHFAYPITPATDVMKRMAVILPQYGGKMLQMESELAVSSALAGAACTGMLCATSSSGPGMTLMQEAISFMCGAELPCLMLDSMRVARATVIFWVRRAITTCPPAAAGMATTMCRCSHLPTVRNCGSRP